MGGPPAPPLLVGTRSMGTRRQEDPRTPFAGGSDGLRPTRLREEPMAVEYRNMRPEDEDVVFDLRMQMWGWQTREQVRRSAYLDPLYLRHTFIALDGDGRLLSSLRYWLRDIRDASGTPRPVG